MQYTEEFKRKALSVLGDTPELRKELDEGIDITHRLVINQKAHDFTAMEIIKACESLNFQDLYKKAKIITAKDELFEELMINRSNNAVKR